MINDIKAVFFDADDTLFAVRDSVGERYLPYFQKYGIQATAQEINRVVPKAWKALSQSYENRENQHICDHDRDVRIWEEYVTYVLSHFSDQQLEQPLFEEIYHEFGRGESRVLNPYVTDFLEHLAGYDLLLGVLTNNDQRIHTLIPELGIGDHFSHIYCASDIGYKKPSREIFDGVAGKVGFHPEQLLYVGDCLRNDVAGARNAGWNVAWYGPDKCPPSEDLHHISCFQEAKKLF